MRQDEPGGRARQRSYNRAFKMQILRECAQPGATVSGVADAHGMNTNNIYRWRRQVARGELKLVGGAEFVALEISPTPVLPASAAPTQSGRPMAPSAATIEVELQRGAVHVKLSWPVQAAGPCADWLREVLR